MDDTLKNRSVEDRLYAAFADWHRDDSDDSENLMGEEKDCFEGFVRLDWKDAIGLVSLNSACIALFGTLTFLYFLPAFAIESMRDHEDPINDHVSDFLDNVMRSLSVDEQEPELHSDFVSELERIYSVEQLDSLGEWFRWVQRHYPEYGGSRCALDCVRIVAPRQITG